MESSLKGDKRWLIVVIASTSLVLVMLSACNGSDPAYLNDLKADPVARWTPRNGVVTRQYTTDYKGGGTSSKRQQAALTRLITLPSPVDVQPSIAAALAYANEHGWRLDSSGTKNSLERQAPKDGVARLSVNPVPTRKDQIVVLLTAS